MKKIKYFIRDFLRISFGKKGYTYVRFLFTHRYWLDFKKPKTFSEKIIFRKFNTPPKEYSKLVDKFCVREYVQDCIGEKYLIPLLKVSEKIDCDFFKSLPDEFVIKTSNGGGGENVRVVTNKHHEDLINITKRFNEYLKIKIGTKIDELFYDIEEPTMLVEKRLKNNDSSPLLDYKFHVFKDVNDEVRILLQINSEYNTRNCTKTLYNIDGNISSIQFDKYNHGPEKLILPDDFEQMVELAIALSEQFSYVRIDLFNVDGKIYFGEITFCPASGWDKINSFENDLLLGSYWGVGI